MSVEHQTPVHGCAFYTTGGTLRHDAPSYVERKADRELLDGLLKGEFCYVLTSRQMGKSSLMVRTANKLREHGVSVAVLDLTAIGQNLTPEQWYHGLAVRLGQLDMEDELELFWDANTRLGPCQRLFTALRKVVLPKLNVTWIETTGEGVAREYSEPGKLVIFVDEIDAVRSLPFSSDEFFAAIRECYNRRTQDKEFDRVTFCLLGVAKPSDLIRDHRIMPFNTGKRVELSDFTPTEAASLGEGLTTPRLLERILHWTGGHPYLTQRLCQEAASNRDRSRLTPADTVDDLCEQLFFGPRAREKDDNLLFVRNELLRHEDFRNELLDMYCKVRSGEPVLDSDSNPVIDALRLSGVIEAQGKCLSVRNRIYERVFDDDWINSNLWTEAWVRAGQKKLATRQDQSCSTN